MDKGYLIVNNLITVQDATAMVCLMDTVLTSRDLENINKSFKNYSRHVTNWEFISSTVYAEINDKLKKLVPKTLQWRGQNLVLSGLAKAVEMIKYDEGGIFDTHCDFLTGGALSQHNRRRQPRNL